MSTVNADKLLAKLASLPAKLQKPISNALLASAGEMEGYAVKKIQTNSGTGREYKRGKRIHIASSPGEYPNSDFGGLVDSMFSEPRGPLEAVWGARNIYAKYLEFGTSRMAARPIMRPTLRALQDKAAQLVKSAIDEALKHG